MVNIIVKEDCLLGIDPGLEGALAFITPEGKLITTYKMPTYKLQRSADVKNMVDPTGVMDIMLDHRPKWIWIEDVWSRPTDGGVSAFSFGEGKGILKGCAAGLGVKPDYVPPATWKAVMGVSAVKATSKRKAHLLFPGKEKLLRSADKCEAALIGMYGLCKSGLLSAN